MTEYRAQLTRRPYVGWVLFVVVPGRVADWPEMDFMTIDGHPPTIAARNAALADLGYRLSDPRAVWEWCETQEGADTFPQEGDKEVSLSAVVLVVAA